MNIDKKTDDIVEWIIRNMTVYVVPADEGNEEALIYNMVQLAKYGRDFRPYDYEPDQDLEIKTLYKKFGREYWGDEEE